MVELMVAKEHVGLVRLLLPAQTPLRGLGCLLLPAQGLHAEDLTNLTVCYYLPKDCVQRT